MKSILTDFDKLEIEQLKYIRETLIKMHDLDLSLLDPETKEEVYKQLDSMENYYNSLKKIIYSKDIDITNLI